MGKRGPQKKPFCARGHMRDPQDRQCMECRRLRSQRRYDALKASAIEQARIRAYRRHYVHGDPQGRPWAEAKHQAIAEQLLLS